MTTQDDAATALGAPRPIEELHPRRRVSLVSVAVIALGAAIAGAGAGVWWRSSRSEVAASGRNTAASPDPAGMSSMWGMPGMHEDAPPRPADASSKAVYVSSARQQLIGVRTGVVARQTVEGSIRTVGTIAYDETRTVEIHTRVSGWVERLYVDYVGKPVRRGQALFAVYSPDLATAQADYLLSLRAHHKLADNASVDLRSSADALLQASRERMRRWNVTDAQIDELEKTGTPTRTVSIVSPFDGVVLEKQAFAGQYLTPEVSSFKLADISSVWAIGQVFEYEAARLHVGDTVDIEFPYGQAAKRSGKIDFIYPEVDPQTRRVRFRVTLDNRDRALKPDTYVHLIWHGDASNHLVIPKEAVIDTGPRKYALIALPNGYFEPRDVQVGPALGDVYPVMSGVAEGDRVVTSAQFLIDSETNLMAAMQSMSMSMPGMDMGGMDMSTGSDKASQTTKPAESMPGMDMSMPGMNHNETPRPAAAPAKAGGDMPGMDMSMPGMNHDQTAKPDAAPAGSASDMPGMDMSMHHHHGTEPAGSAAGSSMPPMPGM